jgi:hypothetical protein
MSRPYLSVARLERRLLTGDTESLMFHPGVNLLVGRANTGKTKWLQTLDFLLGDSGKNPYDGDAGIEDKYESASADLVIGEESIRIERRWRQARAKTKIIIGDESKSPDEFQHWLMGKLDIPILHFPKGNPMSGQTWPELSFRMLLRHIYRQQRFWGDIADRQPEGEQHACLLQFLGMAEHLFTTDYGDLVKLKKEVDKLKARREQYKETLEDLARDIVADPGLTVAITARSVKSAEERLNQEIEELRQRRIAILEEGSAHSIPPEQKVRVSQLSQQRAENIGELDVLKPKILNTRERLENLERYRSNLEDERERMDRAEDAGRVLADLKITHCPACDQPVSQQNSDENHCFLCHQTLPEEPAIEELGAIRLRFERDRIDAELQEINDLINVLQRDLENLTDSVRTIDEKLRMVENELEPARQAVAALVQDKVSAVDVAIGETSERQRQIKRVYSALEEEKRLTEQIADLERQIEPLQARVDQAKRAIDFEASNADIEEGMNEYLNEIRRHRHDVWPHTGVSVNITHSGFTFRVGRKKWDIAVGGTDTLYFLMAYHYGLLTLSNRDKYHYPGLSIIDVPGEFAGEKVEDREDFIVQPFIDLLSRNEYHGAQLIITGAAFSGLQDVNRQELTQPYIS